MKCLAYRGASVNHELRYNSCFLAWNKILLLWGLSLVRGCITVRFFSVLFGISGLISLGTWCTPLRRDSCLSWRA